MVKFLFAACAAGVLLSPNGAFAATYVGTHSVGGGSLQLSISTDDTIGILADSNITDWSLTMTNGGGTITLDRGNSQLAVLSGMSLSATASDLLFDFGLNGLFAISFSSNVSQHYFCVDAAGAGISCNAMRPSMNIGVNYIRSMSQPRGNYVLGSVAGVVPEPATWAMLILGFLGIGSAMRRSRRTRVALTFA